MVFFVNQILLEVERLLANSAPFSDVMKMMLYSLPFIIAQSTPYATLVGFLMCLGGMMSNNEILIFRASGFSFFTIMIPVVVLGGAISLVSFFVNDYLEAARNYSWVACMRCIEVLREYDLRAKGYNTGDTSQKELYREMLYKLMTA